MAVIFVMTESFGFLLARAYKRSRSVYLPFALHLGNNIATMILFSRNKAIGNQILLPDYAEDPVVTPPVISIPVLIIHYAGLQLLAWLLLYKLKT